MVQSVSVDVAITIHHFDHTLYYLRIIPYDADYYLGTNFGWTSKLACALIYGEDNEHNES